MAGLGKSGGWAKGDWIFTAVETMSSDLKMLSDMQYPGRVIIIGKSPDGIALTVVYCITGRSPSSQARRIEFVETRAVVKPTDEEILDTGDPELLIYPAIMISGRISVSNGRQTPSIRAVMDPGLGPVEILAQGLQGWIYEPDDPNFTPRISGYIASREKAALSILKRGHKGNCLKNYFEFPLVPGRGKMISTYTGVNQNPLPAFEGEPLDVILRGITARDTAHAVYEALAPTDDPALDFRVAVVCVFIRDLEREVFEKAIINRHERTNHA
jgi:IMP cyclohydrolase